VRLHRSHRLAGDVTGLDGVLPRVRTGWREILGTAKGEFPVTPQRPRASRDRLDVWLNRPRKPLFLCHEHLRHVVDSRRLDARDP